MVEGGAAKSKESGLASDPKQPQEIAGAQQGGAAELHAKAQAGDNGVEAEPPKVAVQAPYKEDELGAKGVPLGKKGLDDRQPEPQHVQAAKLADEKLDKRKEITEDLIKTQLEREVQARLEKEQVKREMDRKHELERLEREKVEKEVKARIEKEQLEKERQETLARQKLEKEQAEKERVEREVQARVEIERLERERREKLEREKLAQEKVAEERLQQVINKEDNEILEKAKKEKNSEDAPERLAQLKRPIEDRNAGKAAQEAEREGIEALKKGGRDLKENIAVQVDPREGLKDGAVKAEAHPQGSHEKVRDQGEVDLRRKRRALGPGEAGGPPEETRGMPGLEPLLALGGSDLHAALEEQLLAGAMVHSRQIKQASKDEREK